MGARREITVAVAARYRSAGRTEKGLVLDELCKVTGWHRKHAIRKLADCEALPRGASPDTPRRREPTYGATIKDALVALWEASIGFAASGKGDDPGAGAWPAHRQTILRSWWYQRGGVDGLLIDTKVAASGGGVAALASTRNPARSADPAWQDWAIPRLGSANDMVAHGARGIRAAPRPRADDGGCGDRLDQCFVTRAAGSWSGHGSGAEPSGSLWARTSTTAARS